MNKLLLSLLFIFFLQFSFAQSLNEDFEANETVNNWAGDDCQFDVSFSNPQKTGINPSNTVLKYNDVGGSYANIYFNTIENFDLTVNHNFSFKIYVPSSGITGGQINQVSLKLQNKNISESWTTQTEIIKSITPDTWQTVTFDFESDNYQNFNAESPDPKERTDFNKVLIQINGENNTDRVIAYIDDFFYDGTIEVAPETEFTKLVWSDEFDGNELDKIKWFQQTLPIQNNFTNWANTEIQHYTNRDDNSFVSDGTLKILAKREKYTNNSDATTYNVEAVEKDFTSARLNSKYAFTYGKVEIRAKMPFGVGTFPALWMLGQNITERGGYWFETNGTTPWPYCGEIDIIEHWGDNQDYVASALHNESSSGNTVNKGGRTIVGVSTEFHIYSLEWDKDKMIFKVDGIEHYRYNPQNKNIKNWPYDAPQYLLFNVAILPVVTSSFTQSAMEIDYVRVYQEDNSLSVSNDLQLQEAKLYPNPVDGNLTIEVPSNLIGAKVSIFSVLGKQLESFVQTKTVLEKNLSQYKTGVYFIRFETAKGVEKYSILKK